MLSSTPAKINFSTLALDERPSRISHSHRSAYLESLCDYLYDDLRPRILHEPKLSVLCDVCRVLQALMVLDVPETNDEDDTEESITPTDGQVNGTSSSTQDEGLGRLHISHMLQSVLQDAQTRLFFKAQSVVQSDVRYYVPKAEDTNYPEILGTEVFIEHFHYDA